MKVSPSPASVLELEVFWSKPDIFQLKEEIKGIKYVWT